MSKRGRPPRSDVLVFPIRDLNPTRVFPLVTLLLIAANGLVYFFWQPHGGPGEAEFLYQYAAIACEVTSGRPLTVEEFQLEVCRPDAPGQAIFPNKTVELSLFTSMFLHGSLFHLLSNMWFLWLFGNNIEEAYGAMAFVLVYVFAGLVAAIGFIALNPDGITPLIGASGAIAGVLGSYLILFPKRWVISLVVITLLPVPAVVFLGLWFATQFLVNDPGVAWEAHVLGFVAGVIVTLLFRGPLLRRIERLHRRLPPVWS